MKRLKFFGIRLVGLAAALALLISLYILLAPLNIQSITATAIADQPATNEELIYQQSWFQVQGYWGVFILIAFAGLYGWGFFLAQKEAYTWLFILSIGLLMLSYLAGFSIGLLYLPAAIALLIGAALLNLARYRSLQKSKSST